MKIDRADALFSKFIRLRDGKCVRCGRRGEGKYGIDGLQCSHFFGRRMESVRFDEANADSLCFGCHRYWEKEDREGYRNFKVKQLGKEGFEMLNIRAHTYMKKDRKLAAMYWSHRLKEVL